MGKHWGLLWKQTVPAGERPIVDYTVILCTGLMVPQAADRTGQPLLCALWVISVPICMVADGAWLLCLLLAVWLLLWPFAIPLNVNKMFIAGKIHRRRLGLLSGGFWFFSDRKLDQVLK